MNLSTRQLRAFVQVARTGNFTRAAERAHLTQAGISLLVRELERQLGCRLFDRTTRSVVMTTAGRKLLPVVERMLADIDDVAAELGAIGERKHRSLRVAATPLISSHLLPRVLAELRAAVPHLAVALLDADLRDVESMVMDGEADLGLGFFFKAKPGLVRVPLARFQLMRVDMAPFDPASSPDPNRPGAAPLPGSLPWSSLRGARLVGLPPSNPIQKLVDMNLERANVTVDRELSVNFFATLIATVEAGFGTAVVPTFVLPLCRSHRVTATVLTRPRVEMDLFRIAKRGVPPTEIMARFETMLVDRLSAR